MNLLEQVEAARAALLDHKTAHTVPLPGESFAAWWDVRKGLIEALLNAERAAIEAGLLEDFTADF